MVCAGRMTFRPQIHGPVSTTMWLLPASAVDSSTFPMLPSTASTLKPVRSTAGSSTTVVRYVHTSNMGPPPWMTAVGCDRPLLRRYPGRWEAKHGFGGCGIGNGTSNSGKEGVREDGGTVEFVAGRAGDRRTVGVEEPSRAGAMGRL